mgnify:CR=1 FL=1
MGGENEDKIYIALQAAISLFCFVCDTDKMINSIKIRLLLGCKNAHKFYIALQPAISLFCFVCATAKMLNSSKLRLLMGSTECI